MRTAQPFANPYVAGVGLGLVLLATFLVTGHGLGASGAAVSVAAAGYEAVAPVAARAHPFFGAWARQEGGIFGDWMLLEVLGLIIGAAVSARLAGRWKRETAVGPTSPTTPRARLLWAFGGGVVTALGARLARGCTSGLGLSGGAMLSIGAWTFLIALFAAGYAAAPLFKRSWR